MWINRIIVIGLIIATGTFASYWGGTIPYLLFYFSLCLPVTSLIYVLYVYIRFKIYQELGTKVVVKGEPVPYVFSLCNEDYVTYQNIRLCFCHDRSTIRDCNEGAEYCLLPGTKHSLSSTLICNFRGEYTVGIDSVVLTDFLYLFKMTYSLTSKLKTTVLPRLIPLSNSRLIHLNQDTKDSMYKITSPDRERASETHKYIYGDSPKDIHWKLTAKSNQLMSRSYSPIRQRQVLLLCDLSASEGHELEKLIMEDQLIESALALSHYCLTQKILCSLFFCEDEQLEVLHLTDLSDFQILYHKCSKIHFRSSYPLESLVDTAHQSFHSNAEWILLTSKLTDSLYKQLMSLISFGGEISLIFIKTVPTPKEQELLTLFTKSNIKVLSIHKDTTLEEVL